MHHFKRTLFYQGTVLLDDGSEPTQSVRVNMDCRNSAFRQVYTSSGGGFSFQMGLESSRNQGASMDVSVSSHHQKASTSGARTIPPLDLFLLSGCKVYAVLAGFRSDVINLGYRRVDDPDLGVIILHRVGGVRGTVVSLKTLAAPKRAKKAYEKAQKELEKDEPDYSEAAELLKEAVKSYSEFAAAWSLLGEVRLALKDQAGARKTFERAIVEDTNYITPYLLLAKMEIVDEQWQKAAQFTKGVIELNPYASLAHYFNAVAHYSLDEFDVAEESLNYLEKSGEVVSYPAAHYMLGSILARSGEFSMAALEFRHFLEVNSNSQWAGDLRQQLALWEDKGLIDPPSASQPTTEPSP